MSEPQWQYPEDTFNGACERFSYHWRVLVAPIKDAIENLLMFHFMRALLMIYLIAVGLIILVSLLTGYR